MSKLKNIIDGWKNYVFEDKDAKKLAESRAIKCAQCSMSVHGMVAEFLDDEVKQIKGMKCDVCDCPLSTKLRAREEVCPLGEW